MSCGFVVLSVLAGLSFAAEPVPKGAPVDERIKTLPGMIAHVLEYGDNQVVSGFTAENLDVNDPTPVKGLHYLKDKETTDGMDRVFLVAVKPGTTPDSLKPTAVFLLVTHAARSSQERRYFRLSLTGQLESAVFVHDQLDAQGEFVDGAERVLRRKPKDPEARRWLKHELDFYIRWKYRKGFEPIK